MLNIYNLITSIFFYIITYFNISFLLNININKKRGIWLFIIGIILFLLQSIFIPGNIKIIFQLSIFTIIFFILTKNIKKTIGAVIFNYYMSATIEITIILLLSLINIKINMLNDTITFILSIVINILFYIFIRSDFCIKLWNILESKIKEYMSIIILFIIIISYMYICKYYDIMNISIIGIIIILLIYFLLNWVIRYNQIENSYQRLEDYIKLYEKELEEQRIAKHEIHNTLLYIKSMVPDNKEATEFINKKLNQRSNLDHNLLKNIQKIKIPTLKGFLYYKLSECKKKSVQLVLNISPNIDYKKLESVSTGSLKDLVKILGILLDNAEDACLETESKSISIYIYMENKKIIFKISNTFTGTINTNFIYKKGYSTKGKNRGYGLYIVDKVLKENDKLSLKNEIDNDIFTQYLVLDINDKK